MIIATSAVGSLAPEIKPGDFVICDQLVDRTRGRKDTFFVGPKVMHVSVADPYCNRVRSYAASSCEKLGIHFHVQGTIVVIQGPRFSTRAESKWFTSNV